MLSRMALGRLLRQTQDWRSACTATPLPVQVRAPCSGTCQVERQVACLAMLEASLDRASGGSSKSFSHEPRAAWVHTAAGPHACGGLLGHALQQHHPQQCPQGFHSIFCKQQGCTLLWHRSYTASFWTHEQSAAHSLHTGRSCGQSKGHCSWPAAPASSALCPPPTTCSLHCCKLP